MTCIRENLADLYPLLGAVHFTSLQNDIKKTKLSTEKENQLTKKKAHFHLWRLPVSGQLFVLHTKAALLGYKQKTSPSQDTTYTIATISLLFQKPVLFSTLFSSESEVEMAIIKTSG